MVTRRRVGFNDQIRMPESEQSVGSWRFSHCLLVHGLSTKQRTLALRTTEVSGAPSATPRWDDEALRTTAVLLVQGSKTKVRVCRGSRASLDALVRPELKAGLGRGPARRVELWRSQVPVPFLQYRQGFRSVDWVNR